MAQHQDTWPVAGLCAVLEVSRSGLYAYRQGQAPVEIDVAEVTLVARVQAMATQTGHSYGSRRMAKPLQAEGYAVGRYKARRLMPQAGVSVRRRTRGPVTTDSRHGDVVAPNLLTRPCDVAPPDTVWGGRSQTCGRQQDGSLSRCCWTCLRARWWAGRCSAGSMPRWCRPRCAWRWGAGGPRPGCYIMRIGGVNRPVMPIKPCWRNMASAVV